MTVYVDDMRAEFGRMVMCHMIADSTGELEAMARQIGVGLQWIQHKGTHREHFDVCLSKRYIAVVAGAVPITQLELGRMIRDRKIGGDRGQARASGSEAGAGTLCPEGRRAHVSDTPPIGLFDRVRRDERLPDP